MTNEKEWYEAEEYGYPGNTEYNIPKIVAEAMRLGEVKAWEEAKEIVHEVMDCSDDTIGYYEDSIQKNIDTKLTSLKTP